MTREENIMLQKYYESLKKLGHIEKDDWFKLGYNKALEDAISFLKDLEK